MPLVGHALAGVTTSFAARLLLRGPSGLRHHAHGTASLLLPVAVFAAYLPDITSQTLLLVGAPDGQILGHSLWLNLPLAGILGLLLHRGGLPFVAALALTVIGPVLHVILDTLQSPERMPLWPLSRWSPVSRPLLSPGPRGEAAVAVFCILLAVIISAFRGRTKRGSPGAARSDMHLRGASSFLVLAALGVSCAVFVLRESRESAFEKARLLLEAGRVEEGLTLLDSADRWPATSHPGRADYLRGLAFLKQGDRPRAERYLLRSHRTDPRYLWATIDLVLFYANDARPIAARRSLAQPFLDSLARDFPHDPAAFRAKERASTILGAP